MHTDVFDQTGKKVGQVALPEKIFQAVINQPLVAQAIRVRLMNAKVGTASTKTRAEVRGGGRKPWRQKGTGRARQGSIRSPQWAGGGIVHGPRPHKPSLSMPQSMRRAALFSTLTEKLAQSQLKVVEAITLDQPKSQALRQVLDTLAVDRSVLIVLPGKEELLARSAHNLAGVKLMTARVLHPYDIVRYKTVLVLKESLPVLEETFISSGKLRVKKTESQTKKSETTSKKSAKQVAADQEGVKE